MLFLRILLCIGLLSGPSWMLGQDPTMGLLLNSPNSFNGYTLFGNNEHTYLIDNCGRKVNTWVSDYKPGEGMYLLPSGDLLRAGKIGGDFDAGGRGGLFELYNWDGDLIWHHRLADANRHAHHDLAILPNGNFLCLVWEKKSPAQASSQGRRMPGEVWSERILEIEIIDNNQVNIVWEWSIWDHLIQDFDANKNNYGIISDHPELLDLNYIGADQPSEGDWLHLNSIAYNEALDQIVISSRNLSELYVIDHSTSTAEAASHSGGRYGHGGDLLYRYGNDEVYGHGDSSDRILGQQHHVDWTDYAGEDNGAFSIYNNQYIANRQSAAMIVHNPIDENGHYFYSEPSGYGPDTILRLYSNVFLFSDILSSLQVLPNNNLLILEGRSGHAIEINADDEVVWEYINPVNSNGGPGIQGGTPRFNSLFRLIRYPPDYMGLEGRSLIPTEPIELSPWVSDCEIYDPIVHTSAIDHEIKTASVELKMNPVRDRLILNNKGATRLAGRIFNAQGRLIKAIEINGGVQFIDIVDVERGVYFLSVSGLVLKFVKY